MCLSNCGQLLVGRLQPFLFNRFVFLKQVFTVSCHYLHIKQIYIYKKTYIYIEKVPLFNVGKSIFICIQFNSSLLQTHGQKTTKIRNPNFYQKPEDGLNPENPYFLLGYFISRTF